MIKKKVPWLIKGIWYKNDEEEPFYINQNGMKIYSHSGGKIFTRDGISSLLYTDIEGKCLTINKIGVENHEFFGKEITKISYDSKYNELIISGEPIDTDITPYAVNGLEAANAYMQMILSVQEWNRDVSCLESKFSINLQPSNALIFLNMFANNSHKMIPLILQYKDYPNIISFISELTNGKTVYDYTNSGVITKKAINLACKEKIELSVALRASALFNPQEVARFASVLNYCKANVNDIINEICNIPNVNFTKLANYLIKQSFIVGDFKMESESGYNQTLQYVKMYEDYINCIEGDEEADVYPENLKLAHDIAVENNIINCNGKTYNVKEFRRATKKYDNYAWKKDDYSFVIPTTPNDLIQESEKLHHCVKTYISKVINEQTKIVMLRYKGEPYMTIEINGKNIVQTKKKANKLPNEEDNKLLQLWANHCNLLIIDK